MVWRRRDVGTCPHTGCELPAVQWMNFRACAELHSPAALRGATPTVPAPELTADGVRRQWYADRGLPYVPWSSSTSSSAAIDDRNIARGKKRANDQAYRQARTAAHERHTR